MGLTNNIYDIPYAPQSGWVFREYIEAMLDIRMLFVQLENQFAKIRIKQINADASGI